MSKIVTGYVDQTLRKEIRSRRHGETGELACGTADASRAARSATCWQGRRGQRERDVRLPGLRCASNPPWDWSAGTGRTPRPPSRHQPLRARDQPRRGEGGLHRRSRVLRATNRARGAWLPLGIGGGTRSTPRRPAQLAVTADMHFASRRGQGCDGSESPTEAPAHRRSQLPRDPAAAGAVRNVQRWSHRWP